MVVSEDDQNVTKLYSLGGNDILNARLFCRTADASECISHVISQQTWVFRRRDRNCSWRDGLYVRGAWRGGIVLFGQKARKWLKLASVNTTSGVHKSSPRLACSRARLLTVELKQKAGVTQA